MEKTEYLIGLDWEKLEREINSMFEYKSKLRHLVPPQYIQRYKELFFYLLNEVKNGNLPFHGNYLGDNELAWSIYKRKYFLKDLNGELIETHPELTFIRVSSFLAAVEGNINTGKKVAKEFYLHLYNSYFIPGGRVIAGAGDLYRLKTLANCFVSMIKEDNLESIYEAAYEAARTYSYGGGIGIDLSPLRPAGSRVHNAANFSTGAVSFSELYSLTTGLIGQSGRRGALMLTLDVKHPDAPLFIDIKSKPNWVTKKIIEELKATGEFTEEELKIIEKKVIDNTQVRFANISLKACDEFMHAVIEQNTYGKDTILVYKKFIKGTKTDTPQDGKKVHYSEGIPSKDLSKYELEKIFKSIEELNKFLEEFNLPPITEEKLKDPYSRDVFGDFVIELKEYDFDLAIRYAGDFLLYFSSKEAGCIKKLIKARDLWNKFVESNYRSAEPGIIYWSRVTKYSPSNYLGRPIVSTNPCAEVPLEDGGACNLGSINLSRFVKNPFTDKAEIDWETLGKAVRTLVRLLDNVIDWNSYMNPLEKQRTAAKETRRIGLGVMGIADLFLQLGIAYDSEEGLETLEKVMRFIANEAYKASSLLAKEKGPSPIYDFGKASKNPFYKEALDKDTLELMKNNGMRNIALLSIAPTGTISNIAVSFILKGKHYIGVSSGIEPIFALYYKRRSESLSEEFFNVFHSTVKAYLDMKNLSKFASNATEDELKEILPPYFFRTAHNINPEMRIKIQAIAQKYVDHSISSTINLPEDIDPEVMSEIYLLGWKHGLKGVTVYRDGSRYPILSVEGKKTEFQEYKKKKFKLVLPDGKVIVAKGDEIIVLPDGRITTVYHALKKGIFSLSK